MIVRFSVTSTPEGVSVDLGIVGVPQHHLSRTEAHKVAIALLQGCVPWATESVVALELHGQGPDPEASTWQAQWR